MARAVDLAEQVERVDALVAHLGVHLAALLLLEKRHQVRDRLGALQLVQVLGVAHAQVLEAAQHLERELRAIVTGRAEHLHERGQHTSGREACPDRSVGTREEHEDLRREARMSSVVSVDLEHRVCEQLERLELDQGAAQVVARGARHVEHRLGGRRGGGGRSAIRVGRVSSSPRLGG